MMHRIHNNQDGFTLVEIIVSIAILSIVCVVFLKLFTLASQVSTNAGEVDQASIHASNVLELLKSQESIELESLAVPYNQLLQSEVDASTWTLFFDEQWQTVQADQLWKYQLMVTITPVEMADTETQATQLVHIRTEVLKKQETQDTLKSLVLYETDQRSAASRVPDTNTSAK